MITMLGRFTRDEIIELAKTIRDAYHIAGYKKEWDHLTNQQKEHWIQIAYTARKKVEQQTPKDALSVLDSWLNEVVP